MINSTKDSDENGVLKIVLAEDDIDDQEIFIEAVSAAKIPSEITTVDNGQQLIDLLKDESEPNPDLIFIDINMPIKGGKEALAEIKADDSLKEIPAVMLSTSNSPKDIDDTFNNGANLYVQKPNSFSGFILILKRVFALFWTKAILDPLRSIFFVSEKNISKEK